MEKKLDDVIQAFRDQQFEQALRLINVAEKKKDKDKGKQKALPSLNQDLAMDVLKGSCLVKLARYGEAQAVLAAVVVPDKLEPDYAPILLGAVRDIKMQEKQSQILKVAESQKDLMYTKLRKGYFVAQYVYLNKGRLDDASKFFLKLYDTSKNEVHFFSSVYLGYLSVMAKDGLLLQKRNKVVVGKEITNLKMIFLFWDKFLKLHSLESLLGKKLGEEVVKFNARLLISSCQPQKALEFLQKYDLHLTDNWDTLSLYRSIYDQSPDTLPSLLEAYLRIFRQNTDLSLYKPMQEAYYNYVDLLLKVSSAKINQGTSECQLFQLETTPENRLNNFFASLVSDYNQKRSQQQKSSDYYKLSLKTSLLTILYILNKTDNKQARNPYLEDYISLFSNTFTFAQEFCGVSPQPRLLIKPEIWKADNSIIFDINQAKLGYLWKVQKIPNSKQELKDLTKKFVGLYQAAVSLQAMAVLEKGQRLLGDQFIVILNDVFREYFLHQEDFEAVVNILSILESTLKRSPYNFDIKVRLIRLYDRLGSPLRLVQIYETMDIKSAQFETLGYLLYKHIYQFRLYNQFEEVLLKAIRSYQENQKEIQEYTYNCLDQQRHSVMEQFISYHSFLQRSFSKIVLLLVLSRLQRLRSTANQKVLIELALRSLSSQLTFSCDWKVQNSVVEPKRQFCSFFGVFNSPEVVRMQLRCRLQQLQLLQESSGQQLESEQMANTAGEFQSVLAFGLETVEDKYVYHPVGSLDQLYLKQIFDLYGILSRLGFSVNRQLNLVLQGKESQFSQVKALIGRLKGQCEEINARMTIMTQQKVADIIQLLNHYIQLLRKRKKKLKEHEKVSLNQLLEVKESCYLIVCSYRSRPNVFQLWIPNENFCQEFHKTETQLNNLASIERREFDKLYKVQ